MTTNNNDYVLARWRDAITDPPDDCWMGAIRVRGKERPLSAYVNGWFTSYSAEGNLLERPQPGDQWLDVTAIPGVAREAVQAAVDEMRDHVYLGEGWVINEEDAMDIMRIHTGVTPTEAP